MLRRITIEVEDNEFPWLMGFIVTMEHALGKVFSPIVKEVINGREVTDRPDRSMVKYMAIAGREALASLGDATIIGIIYAHLCDNGPKTAKEIQAVKPFNMKTIVASIYRLRQMELVQGQKIDGIEQTSGGWGT